MNKEELEEKYGQLWDTKQVQEDFEILSFRAPYCACKRRSDGLKGMLQFQHMPRFYFGFVDEKGDNDNDRELLRKMKAGEKITIRELLGINSDEDVREFAEKFVKKLKLK